MTDTKTIAGYITVLDSKTQLTKVPFYLGQNMIGRSITKATVVLNEPSISQIHIKLFATDQRMIITDIGSKNGTRINSEDNIIEKNKEFVIDEHMIIHLG